jgi:hypothetical protein
VTPAQAMAMREDIHQVVQKYRDAGRGQADATDIMIYTILLPVDERPQEARS